ncbi:MAG: gliding motility lipoprotein GldH [Bacteroidales bacterium]|nr:gliding motility lipoprotein GldH [Bacteroidales bacterium]
MNNHKCFWLLLVLLTFSFGCSNRKVFEEFKKFDKVSWHRFNYLEFEVPVEDTDSEFDIYISLRHLPEFPHKQLPVNFTIYSPSGEMRTADHMLELNDDEGNSLSKCLGDFCDVSILVREDFKFSETGTFKFRIENKWKKVDLPGIMEVGLLIKKSN